MAFHSYLYELYLQRLPVFHGDFRDRVADGERGIYTDMRATLLGNVSLTVLVHETL